MPGPHDDSTRAPFPVWLKELCYFGGLIIALAAFQFNQSSDLRSAREEMAHISSDVTAIRQSLPDKEVYDLRLKTLDDKIGTLRGDVEFEKAKAQMLREHLIKKGWVD